jgi:DNA-binding NtrC family response regulator
VCQAAAELDKPIPDIPKTLIEQMETYPFKGNIRELKSMVHDAVSRYEKGSITADLFKGLDAAVKDDTLDTAAPTSLETDKGLPTLKEASNLLVEKAMEQAGGNQSAAARILGISQQALSKRLQKIRK